MPSREIVGRHVIAWQPPKRPVRARTPRGIVSEWSPIADELRSRPGEWALIADVLTPGRATGLATHIRLGQLRAFTPTGDFDALSERQPDGHWWVFARYVGDVTDA